MKAKRRKCNGCNKTVKKFFPCEQCKNIVCAICIINNQCPDCYHTKNNITTEYLEDKYEGVKTW